MGYLRPPGAAARFGLFLTDDQARGVLHTRHAWGVTAETFTTADRPPPFDHPPPAAPAAVITSAQQFLSVPFSADAWLWAAVDRADPDVLPAWRAFGDDIMRRAIEPETTDERRARLERLDLLENLIIPLGADEVPEVRGYATDTLSRITSADETTMVVGEAAGVSPASRYLMADDLLEHDACAADAAAGFRSALYVRVWHRGHLHGLLRAVSRQPGWFSSVDLFIAVRLADRAAYALSHAQLASHAAVVARLDTMLAPLAIAGSLRAVFDQISSIARSVIDHDAVMFPVRVGDGTRATFYASSGMGEDLPDTIPVPTHLMTSPDWDVDIVDDIQADPAQHHTIGARLGYRSLLRLSVQLDGQFAGALVFLSRKPKLYSRDDLPLARRLTDRLALALSRERRQAEARRADEASARASRLESRVVQLAGELDERTGFRQVVGNSPPWQKVLTETAQVAETTATVLLLGESGTGKEVVARFLHRASKQAKGPFIALNCAALPEHLLEAELFGYERGAFTGATQSKPGQIEQAGGGTLFLDEVGEMSLVAQAKFLRVLQEREFQRLGGTRVLTSDARVVAATNRNLEKAIANGQFREDLFYRLNVFSIQLPPLRLRKDDILPLADAFIADIGSTVGRPPAGLSQDARRELLDYDWPGNVRELRNVLERAAILCSGGLITSEHLAFRFDRHRRADTPTPAAPAAGDLHTVERAMVEKAMLDARFNKSKAARALGLTRAQLYVRLKRHGIE